jgi:hypothetical protein
MNNIYVYIILLIVFSLIPSLITLYLNERVKNSVKSFFDKKLEEMKKEHSKEISKFQTELNYLTSKQSFKFTKLHEKRLEVIQQTYFLLNENLNLLKDYVKPIKQATVERTIEENEQFLSEQCVEKHNKLVDYFSYNLIYFDENIVNLIDRYTSNSKNIFETYLKSHKLRMKGETPNETMEESSRNVYTQIPALLFPLKEAIEIKFRELLEE